MKTICEFCNEVGGAVYAGEYDASLIGREFVHFKGGRYRLLGFARFSESEELMVVYQTLYGESGMWVRRRRCSLKTSREMELSSRASSLFDGRLSPAERISLPCGLGGWVCDTMRAWQAKQPPHRCRQNRRVQKESES